MLGSYGPAFGCICGAVGDELSNQLTFIFLRCRSHSTESGLERARGVAWMRKGAGVLCGKPDNCRTHRTTQPPIHTHSEFVFTPQHTVTLSAPKQLSARRSHPKTATTSAAMSEAEVKVPLSVSVAEYGSGISEGEWDDATVPALGILKVWGWRWGCRRRRRR